MHVPGMVLLVSKTTTEKASIQVPTENEHDSLSTDILVDKNYFVPKICLIEPQNRYHFHMKLQQTSIITQEEAQFSPNTAHLSSLLFFTWPIYVRWRNNKNKWSVKKKNILLIDNVV